MTARRSPSLPTPKQIRDAHETVSALYPGARITRIGPSGVDFGYSDAANLTEDNPDAALQKWLGSQSG